ncbi:MAG: DsrE family protein [Candidatus Freyarchaeum deiterrae]
MSEKTVMVVVKSKPYSSLNYYEALRTASGLLSQHRVILFWMGDGVYAALKNADKTLTSQFFEIFQGMEIKLYVEEEALKERGFLKGDVISEAEVVDREKISELLLAAQASMVF